MNYLKYGSVLALVFGLLLIWAVVWLGKKYDEETERERWGE